MPVAHPDEDPASLIVRLAGSHFLRPTELFKLYLGQSSSLLADVGTQSQILEQVDTIAGYGREFLLSLGWQRCAGKTVVFRGVTHHPHIHMIVPGGGITQDGRWISSRPAFLLPVRVLGALFRRLFLTVEEDLQRLYANKRRTD